MSIYVVVQGHDAIIHIQFVHIDAQIKWKPKWINQWSKGDILFSLSSVRHEIIKLQHKMKPRRRFLKFRLEPTIINSSISMIRTFKWLWMQVHLQLFNAVSLQNVELSHKKHNCFVSTDKMPAACKLCLHKICKIPFPPHYNTVLCWVVLFINNTIKILPIRTF